MYATCLFCHGRLGRNRAIEHLPVGRRVAFDPGRGRLWVVCPGCARWNLTPFEERWEALEECEKAYRATPRRFSTENIGLARLPEGLDLVRIGRPRRPEFAGWRYGDEFVRRNRRMLPYVALVVSVPVAAVAAQFAGLLGAGTAPLLINIPNYVHLYRVRWRRLATAAAPGEAPRVVRGKDAYGAVIRSAGGGAGDWELRIPRRQGVTRVPRPAADALLPRITAHLNMFGAGRKRVGDALGDLDVVGYGEAYVDHFAETFRFSELGTLPPHKRLALEMAAHEADERRALAGDLAALEAAWREAEEIAAIADRLPDEPA